VKVVGTLLTDDTWRGSRFYDNFHLHFAQVSSQKARQSVKAKEKDNLFISFSDVESIKARSEAQDDNTTS
jgi:hypothetical protein